MRAWKLASLCWCRSSVRMYSDSILSRGLGIKSVFLILGTIFLGLFTLFYLTIGLGLIRMMFFWLTPWVYWTSFFILGIDLVFFLIRISVVFDFIKVLWVFSGFSFYSFLGERVSTFFLWKSYFDYFKCLSISNLHSIICSFYSSEES